MFHYNVLTEQQKSGLLKQIPIDEVWGVGRRLNRSLISRGIETVYQLREADIRTMRSRYGVVMERLISELGGFPVSIWSMSVHPKNRFSPAVRLAS